MMKQSLKKKVAIIAIVLVALKVPSVPNARADLFGGDVAVLTQILIQAIDQVYKLQQIIGKAQQTISILEDMNRGVKEVLRLAETAHIPLPPGVYAQAKSIDQALAEARKIYGFVAEKVHPSTKAHYRSGVEGLSLSQDAFDYSTFLDDQGKRVKRSAVLANQASATRLTAQTLGVLLHAISHSNRLQAKQLEMNASDRIENASKESARFESFRSTHQNIENSLKEKPMSSLNAVSF